jgi:hypothetical protein
VDGRELARRMRYGTLVILVLALVMCLWEIVLGVKELGSSILGGIAVILISVLLLGAIAWRIQFSWKRIHDTE